jgi:two-component sensor histidine kinase
MTSAPPLADRAAARPVADAGGAPPTAPTADRPAAPPRALLRDAPVWRALAWAQLAMFVVRLTYYVFHDVADGEGGRLGHRVFEEVTGALLAAPVIYGATWLALRSTLLRRGWRPLLAAALPAFAVGTVLHTTAMLVARAALGPALGFGDDYALRFGGARYLYEAANAVLPFALLVAGLALAESVLAARERERRAAALERSLLAAELRGLRLQLQPHFLFNALNTISSTMYDDPAAADAQLAQLAGLLRTSLRTSHAQEVPVREELELLEQYLGLMRARFGDRLDVRVEVDDAARELLVPSMLLQPLVENAVQHGGTAATGRGRVHVRVRTAPTVGAVDVLPALEVRVHDDGPGLAPGRDPLAAGTGLSATAQRLQLLHGAAHALRAGNAPEGGFEVVLRVPARRAADAAPAVAPPRAAVGAGA